MLVQEMDAECVPSLIFSYPAPAVHMFYARMAAIKYLVGQWNKDVVLFLALFLSKLKCVWLPSSRQSFARTYMYFEWEAH